MIILLLVILWTLYLVRKLRAQRAATPSPVHPKKAHAVPLSEPDADVAHQHATWGALDDLQLTRLLTNAAPRTPR